MHPGRNRSIRGRGGPSRADATSPSRPRPLAARSGCAPISPSCSSSARRCLHLAYLAWDCPLDLAPDEAHYWDWSRHLDWSYYSKGPLVAWLIRASCELVGDWSEQHTGSLTFAVRLPAVLCGSLLLVSLYVLTVQVFGQPPARPGGRGRRPHLAG